VVELVAGGDAEVGGRTDAILFDVSLGVGAAAVAGAIVWGLAFPTHPAASAWGPRVEIAPLVGGALTSLHATF
jgi:hypothetical protein